MVLGVGALFIAGLKFGPRFYQRQEKRWLHSYSIRKLEPLDAEGKARSIKVRDLEKETKKKPEEPAREPLSIPTMGNKGVKPEPSKK